MIKPRLSAEVAALKDYFDRSTRVLGEADSQFAPQDGMFTVSQQVAHVAQTVEWFIDGAFAEGGFSMDFETMEKEVRATTSLAAARQWLESACKRANEVVEAHSEQE